MDLEVPHPGPSNLIPTAASALPCWESQGWDICLVGTQALGQE